MGESREEMNKDLQNMTDLIGRVLAKEASPQEQERLEMWVNESEENRAFYEEMISVWQITTPVSGPAIDLDSEWTSIAQKLRSSRSGPTKLRLLFRVVAATAAVALIAVLLIHPKNRVTLSSGDQPVFVQAYQTAESTEILLPDGSTVWLRRGSTLEYEEDFSPRAVTLTGEGFFEVAGNPDNPFTVSASDALIEVIGTRFNVRETELGDVELFVEEGKVAFTPAEVQPGVKRDVFTREEYAVMKVTTKQIQRLTTPSSNMLSWRTGKLSFDDDNIERVFADLERHFGETFTVTDSAMLSCDLRADFEGNTEMEVVESIAFMLGWTFERTDSGFVMTGDPCEQTNR